MTTSSSHLGVPRHIVVGTDYSKSSRGAVSEALRLARRFSAELWVVNVVTRSQSIDADAMTAFIESFAPPAELVIHDRIVVDHSVSNALAAFVEASHADLLVVGPKARGFVERHIVGGVAEQLVSKTRCSTLATSGPPPNGYNTVIVAVDGSDAAAHALELSAHLGNDGCRIVLLHVLASRAASALHATIDVKEIERAMITEAETWIEEWATKTLGTMPPSVRIRVEIGAFGHVLEEVTRGLSADLVCMGTVGRKGLAGVLAGNAAERMVRTLGIPLLVAHP